MQVCLLIGEYGVQNTIQLNYAINWGKILYLSSLLKIYSSDEHNGDSQWLGVIFPYGYFVLFYDTVFIYLWIIYVLWQYC